MSYLDRREEPDFVAGVAKIALGIFFGIALIWMVLELRARYELREFEHAAEQELSAMSEAARHADAERIAPGAAA